MILQIQPFLLLMYSAQLSYQIYVQISNVPLMMSDIFNKTNPVINLQNYLIILKKLFLLSNASTQTPITDFMTCYNHHLFQLTYIFYNKQPYPTSMQNVKGNHSYQILEITHRNMPNIITLITYLPNKILIHSMSLQLILTQLSQTDN